MSGEQDAPGSAAETADESQRARLHEGPLGALEAGVAEVAGAFEGRVHEVAEALEAGVAEVAGRAAKTIRKVGAAPPPPPEPEPEPKDEDQPKWRRRKKARPDELVKAAIEVFAEKGFAAANLKDVGVAAGVSKGTVYLYFKSKDDLLVAAVRTSLVPILDFADDLEIDARTESAEELLRLIVIEWTNEFEQRQVTGIPKLVMAEATNFPEVGRVYVDSVVNRARRLFARVIKWGIARGEFRDVNVRNAVDVLLAGITYGQIHRHSLGPFDTGASSPEVFLQTHLDLFLRGLHREDCP